MSRWLLVFSFYFCLSKIGLANELEYWGTFASPSFSIFSTELKDQKQIYSTQGQNVELNFISLGARFDDWPYLGLELGVAGRYFMLQHIEKLEVTSSSGAAYQLTDANLILINLLEEATLVFFLPPSRIGDLSFKLSMQFQRPEIVHVNDIVLEPFRTKLGLAWMSPKNSDGGFFGVKFFVSDTGIRQSQSKWEMTNTLAVGLEVNLLGFWWR